MVFISFSGLIFFWIFLYISLACLLGGGEGSCCLLSRMANHPYWITQFYIMNAWCLLNIVRPGKSEDESHQTHTLYFYTEPHVITNLCAFNVKSAATFRPADCKREMQQKKIHQQHPWYIFVYIKWADSHHWKLNSKALCTWKLWHCHPRLTSQAKLFHLMAQLIYHLSTRWSTKLMRWWQGRRLVTLFLLHSQGKSGSAPWPGVHSQARPSLLLPPSDKLGMSTPLLWKIAWCMAENKTQYIQCFLAFPVSPEGRSSTTNDC